MVLFIDAASGASGDMLLAAALDLGFPERSLRRALAPLGLAGARLVRERPFLEGAAALKIRVAGPRAVRAPSRAEELILRIKRSALSPRIRDPLARTLSLLARAEGFAHGVPVSRVHFHQLAGVDALVELAGLAAALDFFRVKRVHVSEIPMGRSYLDPQGRRRASAGPAACRLLRPFSLRRLPYRFEWTTPTAAAFLAAWAAPAPAPAFRVLRIGRGAGHAAPPAGPRVLRLLLGKVI
ncbi:MAG: DUF111 family protein [Candidatus Omnitrophica bacterium]|nr:DUF111 family protein [Candidatus Omnitrophota bacterium]